MNAHSFLLGAAAILAMNSAVADDSLLPGHALTTKAATARADTVFMGQLVGLDPAKAGAGEYVGKVVYVSRPANGMRPSLTTQNTTARVPAIPSDLGIPVTMKVGPHESAPEVGRSYLFYVKDNTRAGETGYDAVKIAAAADHGLPTRGF